MIIQTILAVTTVGLIFLSVWLLVRLQHKQQLDLKELQLQQDRLASLQEELRTLSDNYNQKRAEYEQKRIDWEVEAAKAETTARMEAKAETIRQKEALLAEVAVFKEETNNTMASLNETLQNYRDAITHIVEPLQNLEKEEAERRYYCLSVAESDDEDIKYLVENVAPKIHNTNLIPKLCWSEYISKAFGDLALKTNIKDEPGIYKITNINTNKCYIGKAVSVKKRLADHLKGACGMTTIADQQIHHAIVEEGFNNWTFEVICYCDKEQLNERERFYIEQFHAQDWGYNRNIGGGG